jgi:hypothetical protein
VNTDELESGEAPGSFPEQRIDVLIENGSTRLFINGMPVAFGSLVIRATPENSRLELVLDDVSVELRGAFGKGRPTND